MSDLTVKELKEKKEKMEIEILRFMREKLLDFRETTNVQTSQLFISYYDGYGLPSDVTMNIDI